MLRPSLLRNLTVRWASKVAGQEPKVRTGRHSQYWINSHESVLKVSLVGAGASQNVELLDEMIEGGITAPIFSGNRSNFERFVWDHPTPPGEESVSCILICFCHQLTVYQRRQLWSSAGRISASTTKRLWPRAFHLISQYSRT
jgi:hypothetical protein